MAHMPRNEGEIWHQTALAGKREGIRQFPSKLLEQIRNEARNKKHCCDQRRGQGKLSGGQRRMGVWGRSPQENIWDHALYFGVERTSYYHAHH